MKFPWNLNCNGKHSLGKWASGWTQAKIHLNPTHHDIWASCYPHHEGYATPHLTHTPPSRWGKSHRCTPVCNRLHNAGRQTRTQVTHAARYSPPSRAPGLAHGTAQRLKQHDEFFIIILILIFVVFVMAEQIRIKIIIPTKIFFKRKSIS